MKKFLCLIFVLCCAGIVNAQGFTQAEADAKKADAVDQAEDWGATYYLAGLNYTLALDARNAAQALMEEYEEAAENPYFNAYYLTEVQAEWDAGIADRTAGINKQSDSLTQKGWALADMGNGNYQYGLPDYTAAYLYYNTAEGNYALAAGSAGDAYWLFNDAKAHFNGIAYYIESNADGEAGACTDKKNEALAEYNGARSNQAIFQGWQASCEAELAAYFAIHGNDMAYGLALSAYQDGADALVDMDEELDVAEGIFTTANANLADGNAANGADAWVEAIWEYSMGIWNYNVVLTNVAEGNAFMATIEDKFATVSGILDP